MRKNTQKCGFTLVEIMIVVVIIGLLAALAIPAFARVREVTRHTKFFNDVRIFRDAIEVYAMEEGKYPHDSNTGSLAAELEPYIRQNIFESASPIGGDWDVEYNDSGVISAVGVHRFHVDVGELTRLDARFDDGLLDSGRLQRIAGDRFYYVIEE